MLKPRVKDVFFVFEGLFFHNFERVLYLLIEFLRIYHSTRLVALLLVIEDGSRDGGLELHHLGDGLF